METKIINVGNKSIHFHWQYGRVTLTWRNIINDWEMATGIVRIHDNAEDIPGDYHSCVTVIVKNGIYELEAFIGPKPYGPKKHEFMAFYEYLESLGLKKLGHIRANTGKQPRVVKSHKSISHT